MLKHTSVHCIKKQNPLDIGNTFFSDYFTNIGKYEKN